MTVFDIRLSTILKNPMYEAFTIESIKFPDDSDGTRINHGGKYPIQPAAGTVSYFLQATGLLKSIRRYPPKLLVKHDGERFTGATIEPPHELRVVYDPFPLSGPLPIMKVSPIKDGLWIDRIEMEKMRAIPKRMTASIDGVDLEYDLLQVLIKYNPCDDALQLYYGKSLKMK